MRVGSRKCRENGADALASAGPVRPKHKIKVKCWPSISASILKTLVFKGKVVRPERFELPTFWFVARHSIQLSYGRTVAENSITSNTARLEAGYDNF